MTTSSGKESQVNNEIQGLEFMCEMDGYRYYKNTQDGKKYCLDSAGTWYTYDESNGVFTPYNITQQNVKKTKHEDNIYFKLKNLERFGIKFDNNGRPIYPKNEKGLFILPKDEKGLPFFPVDDRNKPIFPYDYEKDELTFPVDETDEPIFPRNEQNKPIVPNDKNGHPIFPVDKNGSFIFPLDENNCPVPALNLEGTPVVPKDTYGNFVIPQNREGKPFIYIAADGVTPISAAEWKLWKKYYKEQTKNFYQKQQQQQMPVNNSSYPNSIFHPLNLEQQQLYFAADMEMLQLTRHVRPEDVDLPYGSVMASDAIDSQKLDNEASDAKQSKRKKFLEAQLKSIKMNIPNAVKKENLKKTSDKRESRTDKEMKKKIEKKNDTKKSKDVLQLNTSENNNRKRHNLSSHTESISPKRQSYQNKKQRKARSPSYSSSSSSTSTYGSYDSNSSNSDENNTEKRKEEKEIRNRIISRGTHDVQGHDSLKQQLDKYEEKEYGPKPPAPIMEKLQNSSDMELSDGGPNLNEEQQQKENVEKSECFTIIQEPLQLQRENNHNTDDSRLRKENTKSGNKLSNLNVKEVLKSGDLQMIKMCKEQEQQKYDHVKLQIAELEVERSVHKRNWTLLRDAEKRFEGKRRMDVLSGNES